MPKFRVIVQNVEAPVPEPHGDTQRPVIERCPNCLYAYADGGYCPECEWFRPRHDCPHCRKLGIS